MINTVEKIYEDGELLHYKMTLSDGTITSVPLDEANTDYQAIMEYIENGGEIIDNGATINE